MNIHNQKFIQDLFHENVKNYPDNTAIIFDDHIVSYGEFNCLANQFANYLLTQKNEDKCIIAVLLERSVEMVITLFGIFKIGCAYLPLNGEDPKERIEFMLKDSNTTILVTSKKFKDTFDFKGKVIYIEEREWIKEDKNNPNIIYTPNDLVYVIYTSGTTGNPKGVLIEQEALLNRLLWMQKQFPITSSDIILHKTPYTFDVSVWELFWWSMVGASISLLNPGEHKNIKSIVAKIKKHKVTVIHFVPSMLSIFLDYIKVNDQTALGKIGSLKYIFCSGEALKSHQVHAFNNLIYSENNTRLVNLYGPTEAAIDVTYFDCTNKEEMDFIPIGKPIDNINIYIVDKTNDLCQVGEVGEICISGIGLARGYLNRDELNDQKFIHAPWNTTQRIYRTGDLGQWLEDGNIKFLGRIDHQVKIHGNRIELEEIEFQLVKSEGVKEAIVLAVDGKMDNQYLCAFIVPSEHCTSSEDILGKLRMKLPEYMIPALIRIIHEIPLSVNGKADTKKLLVMLDNKTEDVHKEELSDFNALINILNDTVNLTIPISEITYTHSLNNIGIDSLSFLRILIGIEKTFSIEFDMDDLDGVNLDTVDKMLAYIKEKRGCNDAI